MCVLQCKLLSTCFYLEYKKTNVSTEGNSKIDFLNIFSISKLCQKDLSLFLNVLIIQVDLVLHLVVARSYDISNIFIV